MEELALTPKELKRAKKRAKLHKTFFALKAEHPECSENSLAEQAGSAVGYSAYGAKVALKDKNLIYLKEP